MAAPIPTEILYFGLKLSELVTLIGIIIGPIAAVVITLFIEARREKRSNQIQIMRMLLNTRHLPADAAYNAAINLVPAEFNKNKKVMDAWRNYIEAVRFSPTPENKEEHHKTMNAKQTKLIYQIMISLKFNLPETDIQTSPYVSGGFIDRDNLYLDSLKAMRDIASEIKEQNDFIRKSIPSK